MCTLRRTSPRTQSCKRKRASFILLSGVSAGGGELESLLGKSQDRQGQMGRLAEDVKAKVSQASLANGLVLCDAHFSAQSAEERDAHLAH